MLEYYTLEIWSSQSLWQTQPSIFKFPLTLTLSLQGRGIIEETACRSLKIFVSQKENRPIRVQRHAG